MTHVISIRSRGSRFR